MQSTTPTRTLARPATARAFGLIRQSRTNDGTLSPVHQRERLIAECQGLGFDLVEVAEELSTSGGNLLDRRPGLSAAIAAMQAGQVDVLVVAYFDRLFRSLPVQAEVIRLVKEAGGTIHVAGLGEVETETINGLIQSTLFGLMADVQRRQVADRTADAKRDAVARGVAPFNRIPPGIRRRDPDRVLEPDPAVAPLVVEAFQMRADGVRIQTIRDWLAERGVEVTMSGMRSLLASRLYLGELRFGAHENLDVFPPIVDPELWRRVQAVKVPKGRYGKSERLLARLGILRCSGCGKPMHAHTRTPNAARSQYQTYYSYRCVDVDCPRRVSVAAEVAERVLADAAKLILREAQGAASMAERVEEAELRVYAAETAREQAVLAFDGIGGDAAREKLRQLQADVDDAQAALHDLTAAAGPTLTLALDDFDDLAFDARRRLLRLAVESATVAPPSAGAIEDRIRIVPRALAK